MKSKKIRSLFCAAALTLSLAACGSKTSDYSDQTITGEITDIDGTAVTMQLGELSAGGMPSHDVSGSSDSGQTPPDKPDGETQSGSSFTAGEVWGDRIFEKCGIGRDEGGDDGKTLEIRGKRRLSARDGGANYQQS